MTSRARRNSKTRALILETAQRQFAHYGFTKVTMDEIAHGIAMGKASLYYYFRTKESLFEAVIVNEHEQFMSSVAGKLRDNIAAADKVRAYVVERHKHFSRLLNLNILDLRGSMKMRPIFAKLFDKFTREELKLLQTIIHDGRATGEFRIGSTGKVAEALLHVMQGLRYRFLRTVDGPRVEGKQDARLGHESSFVTEIFLRGIQK